MKLSMVGAGWCDKYSAKQKVCSPHRLAHLRLGWARQAGDALFLHGKKASRLSRPYHSV